VFQKLGFLAKFEHDYPLRLKGRLRLLKPLIAKENLKLISFRKF